MSLHRFMLAASVGALVAAGPPAQAQTPPDGGTKFQPFTSVWSGVYTRDEADRGKRAAADLCGRCHGAGLDGTATAPVLVGPRFFERWHDLRLGDLIAYIQSAMPREHAFFVPAQTARDVSAFMLRESGVPAGKTPIPTDVQALSEILITRPPAAQDPPAR